MYFCLDNGHFCILIDIDIDIDGYMKDLWNVYTILLYSVVLE